MKKRKNWYWILFVTISILIFGLIIKDLRFLFFAVIFSLLSGLIIQLLSGRVLDRRYNESTSKVKQPRFYWDIILANIIAIILAICGYIMLFITRTLK